MVITGIRFIPAIYSNNYFWINYSYYAHSFLKKALAPTLLNSFSP
jgi:hypothetical protein